MILFGQRVDPRRPVILTALIAVFSLHLSAQSSFYADGYVKELFSILKPYQTDALIDNLVHQRTNVYWNAKKYWSAKASLRTRIFYGDQSGFPLFGDLVDMSSNDFLDLSVGFDFGDKGYFHSYFDRLYLDYTRDKWQFRLGRQRINWGIHTIWNPNDLYNAYNYADFDYEERAGTDAFTARFYYNELSDVEFAIRAFDNWDDATIALKWRTNVKGYDLQFISGFFEQQVVFGNGWAGNLGQWSFKGEWSLFFPVIDELDFGASAAIGFEYVTKGGLSMNFSGLYNADGKVSGGLGELFIFTPSARNLYPYRWAIFTSLGYQVHPLIYVTGAIIYSPVPVHPLFFNPGFTWSVTTNLDLDLVFQIAFNRDDMADKYISAVQGYFLRVKWSF